MGVRISWLMFARKRLSTAWLSRAVARAEASSAIFSCTSSAYWWTAILGARPLGDVTHDDDNLFPMQRDSSAPRRTSRCPSWEQRIQPRSSSCSPHPLIAFSICAPRRAEPVAECACPASLDSRQKKPMAGTAIIQDAARGVQPQNRSGKAWNMALSSAVVCQISSSFRMCSKVQRGGTKSYDRAPASRRSVWFS